MKMRTVVAMMVMGAGLFGTSACKASVSTGTIVAKDELQQEISDQFKARVGSPPKTVTCPGNLKAVKDTTMRCVLTAVDGTVYGLTVIVTSVKGKDVAFDVKVDDPGAASSGSPTTT